MHNLPVVFGLGTYSVPCHYQKSCWCSISWTKRNAFSTNIHLRRQIWNPYLPWASCSGLIMTTWRSRVIHKLSQNICLFYMTIRDNRIKLWTFSLTFYCSFEWKGSSHFTKNSGFEVFQILLPVFELITVCVVHITLMFEILVQQSNTKESWPNYNHLKMRFANDMND